jgi:hypothetical protein
MQLISQSYGLASNTSRRLGTAGSLLLLIMVMITATTRVRAQEVNPPARLAPVDSGGATFRLYDGLTMLLDNPSGKGFTLALDVRDLNLTEPGPREVLVKFYDPSGKAIARQILADDGVTTPAGDSPTGGWDHEGAYYIYHEQRGLEPMLRWSGLCAPDRLAAVPVRTVSLPIPAGVKGVYRLVLVGSRDHVVTIKQDAALDWAVGGNPFFLHPVGALLQKRYVSVPRGATGLNIALVELDRPRTRTFTLTDESGQVVAQGSAPAGVGFVEAKPAQPGAWDGKVLTFELSDKTEKSGNTSGATSGGASGNTSGGNSGAISGATSGGCMVQFSFILPAWKNLSRPLPVPAVPAFYAATPQAARALKNGAIEDGEQTYWQPAHRTLDLWVRSLKPEDFEIRNPDGKPAPTVTLKTPGYAQSVALDITPNRNSEFIPLNGIHERAPLADTIMFSYALHRNPQALNVAIRDTVAGLGVIGPGDHVMNSTWKGMANQAYEFGTYRFHWWRSAWRLISEKDTPEPVRVALRQIITDAADRLAFCRGWERINGNAFTTVLCGLRYAVAATDDPMHRALFETFHDRFLHGGFGPRVGMGPSGAVQEEFAYDNHYGSYAISTTSAVARDLDDKRFVAIEESLRRFFSYTFNPDANACPFSSRTFHNPSIKPPTEGPFIWKGLPGADLTESINNANEFFAARRKSYYVLSYHGRITPKWQTECFNGQMGWSGGVLCQFVVPGRGTVLASTLDAPGYGMNQHPSQWRSFRINSIVGQTTDGQPLVGADGEHLNATLTGNTVTGSGEVRNSSVRATRSYTYNADHVIVEASLNMTDNDVLQGFWFPSPFRGGVAEAWEMIPFLPNQVRDAKGKTAPTQVKVLDAEGKEVGTPGEELLTGQSVVIDRGGFGVRIELDGPMQIKRGTGNTVMIRLIEGLPLGARNAKTPPNVEQVKIRYRLVPFGA